MILLTIKRLLACAQLLLLLLLLLLPMASPVAVTYLVYPAYIVASGPNGS